MLGRQLPSIITERVPGPASERGVERLARTECPSLTMRRARRAERSGAAHDPIVWVEARGANVVDADGNVFVDLIGAFGVCAVGHAHPRVTDAVARQAARLPHALGDVHPSSAKLDLLDRLAAWLPFDARIVLGLNGADAIAAALKTAVLATGRPGVVAFEGGYHGLMYGPLAICGSHPGFREPFAAQLNPHVRFLPYGDAAALEAIDGTVGAVVVEPALGRGGLVFPPEGWLAQVEARARAAGAVVIVDEILTGFGRTGRRFAFEGQLTPDLVCVGKALGGGLPISACAGTAEVMAAWGDPDREAIHTATFAGYPIGCAAACAALDAIEDEGLVERARAVGEKWRERLARALGSRAREVRGRGLMIGVELDDGAKASRVVQAALTHGWLLLGAGPGGRTLQLTPPLTIDEALLDAFSQVLPRLLDEAA
ncbi:MAG: aminotransferase class III-fold pyridoxal phosphate-dependent enzyme [Sandaracinaceae bacterium]|nr:aminotransferase class III-fold pyridoxal phosphate-dependent enzyme [Sandaracinaceae bacterium]